LCRLLLHGDGQNALNDEWIKPWCLDKWKQYVKERKVYRHWINHLNHVVAPRQIANQANAFERWKRSTAGMQDFLNRQTHEYLKDRSFKRTKELEHLANRLEKQQEGATDLRN